MNNYQHQNQSQTHPKHKQPRLFTIAEILTSDSHIIPMYQRNYAWEEQEIIQLLEDVADYLVKHHSTQYSTQSNENYYIGSLVLFDQTHHSQYLTDSKHFQPLYEVIDGQQRLTTLTLLAIYLHHNGLFHDYKTAPKLKFECRENSTNAILNLFKQKGFDESIHIDSGLNTSIINGYKIIDKNIDKILREKLLHEKLTTDITQSARLAEFATYLLNNVKILRVEVPADTDLNHYFEVMNNRGEQLEKHEIIKAKLLEVVKDEEQTSRIINDIWEYTSDMDSYIQSKYSTELRIKIFTESWNGFSVTKFSDLQLEDIELNPNNSQINAKDDNLDSNNNNKANETGKNVVIDKGMNIDTIINNNHKGAFQQEINEQKSMRFSSLINFENFLLQVLRVSTDKDVSLDDKNLLTEFDKYLLNDKPDDSDISCSDKSTRVKKFAYDLLKCKFLFDNYVIKREHSEDSSKWSLTKLCNSSNNSNKKTIAYNNRFGDEELNNKIRMLLASFHVSIPTFSYKYWLNGALYWLFNHQSDIKSTIKGEDYLAYLENMAKSFMFDRYLTDDKSSYYQMIHENKCQPKSHRNYFSEFLRYQQIENIFVFNYLDYLIWKNEISKNEEKTENDEKIKNEVKGFEFSARSSVEHFYAQNPEGYAELTEKELHNFGNLFLLSHSQNSSLSNKPPKEKQANFESTIKNANNKHGKPIPTLKLLKLINQINNSGKDIAKESVYTDLMKKHEKEMIQLLRRV